MHRMTTMLLAALALAIPAAADAADYTILIYETPADLALRSAPGEAGKAYWAGYAGYGTALSEAHVLRGGAALVPSATASGPVLSGYFVIDVPDAATAAAWAAKAPSFAHGGSAVALAHLPMAAAAK